ncbi:Lipoprotein OS=Streptomyces alboniger OX=132473 GN=CP975_23560 PE=4 SV=1 [Streptomyces alboniger]
MAANRKLLAVAVACAAAVIGIAGCGSDGGDKDPFDGMSADKIAEKASKASKDAGSYRMKGQMKQSGEVSDIEFAVAESGDCKGTMGSAKSGRAEFLSVGEFTYSKGDEKFWGAKGGGSTAELLKGRWVKTPAKGDRAVCNPDDMFSNKNLKKLKRGDDTEVAGAKAAVLTRKKGDETTTFYVAMEGKPYFLKVVNKGSDGPGTVTFSDYGKTVEVKAPPASEVVDPEKLASGS